MAVFVFIVGSILEILVSCYFGLLFVHLIQFLFLKDKTFERFKNMIICTFWQVLLCPKKMDKYKWLK